MSYPNVDISPFLGERPGERRTVRVVLVDDDQAAHVLVRNMLPEPMFDISGVKTLDEFFGVMQRWQADVVLLDLNLRDSSGIETLRRVTERFPASAVIVVTGAYEDELGVHALAAGAQDYLVKGKYDAQSLHRAIYYTVERKKARDALRLAYDELEVRVQQRTSELVTINNKLQSEIIERKRVEHELTISEAHLRTVLETVREGITFSDSAGHFYIYNREMELLTGYSKEDADRCEDFTRLLYPDPLLRQDALRGISELASGGNRETETAIVTKSGIIKYVQVSSFLVFSGGERMFLSVYRDITEHKKAQEAVRMSEERYRAIVEDQTEFVCRFLPNGVLTFVNEAFCRYFGKARNELVGSRFLPDIAAEDLSRFEEARHSLLSWDNPWVNADYRVVLGGGQQRWQQWTYRAIFDANKRLVEIQAVGRDITDKKAAEYALMKARDELEQRVKERTQEWRNANEQLRREILEHDMAQQALLRSEARYRGLFEDSPTALWEEDFSEVKSVIDRLRAQGVTDLHPYFQEHPEAVAECIGLVKIVDVNKAALELYEAKAKTELLSGLQSLFGQECQPVFLYELDAIASGRVSIEMEAVNYSVKGKKLHVTVKWTVAPGYEETFGKVFVAIIDITQRKRNEEQISASLKEKDILLKEVNHRVKNNLQVISSLLNLQVKHIKDPADVEVFRECQNRVKSMVFIHEKLYKSQDFARIDFSSYVRTLTGTLFQSYGVLSDRVSLDIDVQDGLTLGVDRAIPCGLIVNELVSNALKYAFPEDRTGLIRISAKSSDGIYKLRVSDNGKGIPPGLDYRHTQSLGMQLVNTLTDQLEGAIELETGSDTGTMFTITFGESKDKHEVPGEL